MDYYNPNNFSSMQEEAIRRVREMQKRSRNLVNGIPPQQQNESEKKAESHQQSKSQQQPKTQQQSSSSPLQGLLGSILGGSSSQKGQESDELFNIGGIKIDEEKALIALMIYVLFKNGADMKMLLGLGYLLL